MKMRKLLSLVLASSMVVSSFSMSFAAPSVVANTKLVQNVENANVVEAVKRLNAFGIVNGMDDGEYHPEIKVTREQLAKMIVEALGLSSAVPAAKGTSSFKDVDANRWSTGYINVAYGQGIIKGSGDGNFNPTSEVTYAEAITMLVRALGYKDQFISDRGSWPSNYIAQAADLDITDNVTYANASADRGDVAVMLNNTLDANIVEVTGYGRNIVNGSDDDTKYSKSDKTLLEDKLGFDKVSDLRIVGTPSLLKNLDSDEVTIKAIKDDVEIDGKELKEGSEKSFDTKVATDYLLGEDITGYFDGDEVVYIESDTDKDNVFRAAVKDDDDGKQEDVVVEGSDSKFGWADDAVVYIDNDKVDFDFDDASKKEKIDFEKDNLDGDYVFARKMVVENGDIVFLDAVKFEEENRSMVVKSVDFDKERINVFETFNGDDDDRDLKLDDYDYYDIFTEEGIKLELKDLEKNDLVFVVEEEEDNDRAHVIVATNRTVTGSLDEYKQGEDNKGKDRTSVEIEGKSYDLADNFTFTDDDMDTLKKYSSQYNMYDNLEDVFDEDVTAIRDLRGNVAFLSSTVEASVDKYAVVLGSEEDFGDTKLKVWNTEGVVAFYEYDDDKLPLTNLEDDAIIKYDLASNGDKIKIEEIYNIETTKVTGKADEYTLKSAYRYDEDTDKAVDIKALEGLKLAILDDDDTFEKDAIKLVDKSKVYNESDSVYINYAEYLTDGKDDDDLEIFDWKDLEGNDASADSKVLVITEAGNNDVELMVFVNDDNIADSEIFEGYVAEVKDKKDVKTVKIDVVGVGIKTYVIDESDENAYDNIKNENIIVFTEKGSSIKLISNNTKKMNDEKYVIFNPTFNDHKAMITKADGRDITITGLTKENNGLYKLASDAVVYNDDESKSKGDLDAASDKTIYTRFIAQGREIKVIQYKDRDKVSGDDNEESTTDNTVDLNNLKTKASDFTTEADVLAYIKNLEIAKLMLDRDIKNDDMSNTEYRKAVNDKINVEAAIVTLKALIPEIAKTEKVTIATAEVTAVTAEKTAQDVIIAAAEAKKVELADAELTLDADLAEAATMKAALEAKSAEAALAAPIAFGEAIEMGEFVVSTPVTTFKTAAATTTTRSALALSKVVVSELNKVELAKFKEDLVFQTKVVKEEIKVMEAKKIANVKVVEAEETKITKANNELVIINAKLAVANAKLAVANATTAVEKTKAAAALTAAEAALKLLTDAK